MRRHRPANNVQMFSFLDAMVCTMGALLVLVHAFARHGQEQVVKSPELKAARENLDATTAEIETLEWRTAQLKLARDKTQAQLDDERLKLSHVEDHQRRLLSRLDELKVGAEEMERLDDANSRAEGHAAADLDAVEARVRQARDELANARKAAQEGAVNYSVVPYQGPNATHRRPIYIECRRDAIVLQPEGVELTEDEFAGYLGPGNPLAAAVRGMGEYWARQAPGGAPKTEPYPLLLVRPEGIKAYYAARAALDSWGSDFGYELVGSDWQLKFPERDEQLAQLTREIVADAAVRARALVVSLSQLSKNRPRAALHASAHGGFVQDRSRHAGDGPSGVGGRGRGWDSIGSNWAQDGDGGDTGEATGSFDGDATRGGTGGGSNRYGQYAAGRPSGGSSGQGNGGEYAGQPGGQPRGQRGGEAGRTAQGQSHSPGDSTDFAAGQAPGGAVSSTSSGGAAGSAGDSASQTIGTPSATFNASKQSKKTSSIAKARGRDWGLPDGGSGAAPATRPILVECHNDRLVILSEERGYPAKEVRLGPQAQDSMDDFVSHVWQHMKGWGTAGKGLYWRPTLVMDVKPGAADRYAEVKSLLEDSGLDVHERRTQTAQQPASKNSAPSMTK